MKKEKTGTPVDELKLLRGVYRVLMANRILVNTTV